MLKDLLVLKAKDLSMSVSITKVTREEGKLLINGHAYTPYQASLLSQRLSPNDFFDIRLYHSNTQQSEYFTGIIASLEHPNKEKCFIRLSINLSIPRETPQR